MIKKLTLLYCFLFALTGYAQSKTTIAFLPMGYDSDRISPIEFRTIQDAVVNAFVASKKFTVVDREKLEDLEKEKNLQRTEAFLDSENRFQDNVSKGANYLVDANIMGLTFSEDGGKWKANITVQIKLLNVSTAEILTTESISSESGAEETTTKVSKLLNNKTEGRSREEAYTSAILSLTDHIKSFAAALVPLNVDIVSWDLKKKEMVLAAGSGSGVTEGQIVEIVKYTMINIGGEDIQRSERIGGGKIIRIDGANFSLASIEDNLKELKKIAKKEEKIGVIIR